MNFDANVAPTPKKQSTIKIATIAKISVLGALAAVLMIFEIPLWFAPSFYKIDLSEIPVLIGAFALGPMAGVAIEFIKIIGNFLLNGTLTAGIGELANFLIGIALVLPASLVYKNKKTRISAVIGLSLGTICMTILGGLLNAYVLLPVYAKVFMPMDALIAAGTGVNGNITDLTTFVLFAVTPFNLLKGILVSVFTMVLYKYLSPILKSNKVF
ncbi:MAG TPA: ECF transporter S component [Candidatus Merdenecus merdavium]|nr:ECF transporter S component [Candidatus Merdenecus merdavium]